MRRNPLLYSDHGDTEGPEEIQEPQKTKRSLFFYFIILANSLLVVFVLGIIWFLFLKSPDLHIKELSQRFLGTEPAQTIPVSSEAVQPSTVQSNFTSNEDDTAKIPTRQEQEEIQQMRLKQMREQEELVAERQRLEKIRAELEAEQAKNKAETDKEASQDTTEPPKDTGAPVVTTKPAESTLETINSADSTNVSATTIDDTVDNTESALEVEKEPAVVPNAASETLIPPSNTVDTQVDQIMELMKQQQQEKKTEEPLNDSRAPVKKIQQDALTIEATPTISPKLIEEQLDALIETETLKTEAGKVLQQATDQEKMMQINPKLSKLQANAV